MNYRDLSAETWEHIDRYGDIVSGYRSTLLSDSLHIFIDEKGSFHFAVETAENHIQDPLVNGLTVSIRRYRMGDGNVRQMIDVCCSIQGYLEEFTGVIKEISECIIDKKESPAVAVSRIVLNWKAFWTGQNRQMLSEEEIIGLICELYVLHRLCGINQSSALSSWTGPIGGKNDFSFTSWELEIKATRNFGIVHTINGIDQLRPSSGKSLGFISFLVSVTDRENSISLPGLIEQIINECLSNRADFIAKLNELLAGVGYNPAFVEQYRGFKIEILRSAFYVVEDIFPRLTSEELTAPLNNRITRLRYDISLQNIPGINLNEINWGDYFY